MNLTINFDTLTATTSVKSIQSTQDGLYSILFNGAFSNNVKHIDIVNSYFVGSRIIQACKVCIARSIGLTVNGIELPDYDSLRHLQQNIFDFIESIEMKEQLAQCTNIIVANRELIPYYTQGMEELHTFLDAVIHNSGYDVDMSSLTSYDKLSHGSYEDNLGVHEWSRNYTAKGTTYAVTLLDKLNMYLNIKFYKEHGFLPERTEPEVVVPVSACDLSVQMLLS
jgi:hypothetical protein